MSRRSREERDLQKENDALRRQLARLRKQVERLSGETIEEDEQEEKPVVRETCPLCGSEEIARFSTPSGKKLVGCKTCKKWRK